MINELLYTSFKSGNFIYDLAEFHIRYERIHPFGDGNGRTGRVLLNKFSLANGYAPFVIPQEKRDTYMKLLADVDIDKMADFITTLVNEETKRMEQFQIKTEGISKNKTTGKRRNAESELSV